MIIMVSTKNVQLSTRKTFEKFGKGSLVYVKSLMSNNLQGYKHVMNLDLPEDAKADIRREYLSSYFSHLDWNYKNLVESMVTKA